MSSASWSVNVGSVRYVAKSVDARQIDQFTAGLSVAEHVAAQGFDTDVPLPSAAGTKCVLAGERALALLSHVPGRPLRRDDPLDQQWWGDRLGAIHRALCTTVYSGLTRPGMPGWHWIRPEAPHLNAAAWLRPAVAEAVLALTKLQVTDRLSYGTLHGDPHSGAFLLDIATGRIGLTGWESVCTGPFMYDVAAAVMHAGGPDHAAGLLDAYLSAGPVSRAELEAALPTMLRFCWAVRADAAARRADPVGLELARIKLTTQVFED